MIKSKEEYKKIIYQFEKNKKTDKNGCKNQDLSHINLLKIKQGDKFKCIKNYRENE